MAPTQLQEESEMEPTKATDLKMILGGNEKSGFPSYRKNDPAYKWTVWEDGWVRGYVRREPATLIYGFCLPGMHHERFISTGETMITRARCFIAGLLTGATMNKENWF